MENQPTNGTHVHTSPAPATAPTALAHNHPVHNHPVHNHPVPHVHGQYMPPSGLGADTAGNSSAGGSFVLGMLAGAAILYFVQSRRTTP